LGIINVWAYIKTGAIYAAVKAQVEEADQAILRTYGEGEPTLE
jgi:hypothetical protein